MKIIGIDPGYDRLGIAVIENGTLLYSDCFTTSAKADFYDRLRMVAEEVQRVMDKYKPDAFAIESLYMTKNQKTAMRVAEARGVIVCEAAWRHIPIYEYTPGQIKVAVTGHGGSDKVQVTKMIPLLVKMPKNSDKEKRYDDEYDAIAVALTCEAHEKGTKKR